MFPIPVIEEIISHVNTWRTVQALGCSCKILRTAHNNLANFLVKKLAPWSLNRKRMFLCCFRKGWHRYVYENGFISASYGLRIAYRSNNESAFLFFESMVQYEDVRAMALFRSKNKPLIIERLKSLPIYSVIAEYGFWNRRDSEVASEILAHATNICQDTHSYPHINREFIPQLIDWITYFKRDNLGYEETRGNLGAPASTESIIELEALEAVDNRDAETLEFFITIALQESTLLVNNILNSFDSHADLCLMPCIVKLAINADRWSAIVSSIIKNKRMDSLEFLISHWNEAYIMEAQFHLSIKIPIHCDMSLKKAVMKWDVLKYSDVIFMSGSVEVFIFSIVYFVSNDIQLDDPQVITNPVYRVYTKPCYLLAETGYCLPSTPRRDLFNNAHTWKIEKWPDASAFLIEQAKFLNLKRV